jgi:hypothetical protein
MMRNHLRLVPQGHFAELDLRRKLDIGDTVLKSSHNKR